MDRFGNDQFGGDTDEEEDDLIATSRPKTYKLLLRTTDELKLIDI